LTGYDAYKEILNELLHLTGANVAHLLVPTESKDKLEIIVGTSQDEGSMVEIDRSVAGRAFGERRSVNIGDTEQETHYQAGSGPRNTSDLAVPVQIGDLTVGVLNIESQKTDAFTGYHELLMQTFSKLAI